MQQNIIAGTISRSNRNLLVVAVVGLLAVGAFGLLTFRYFSSFFSGPYAIPREELLATADADDVFRYYVTVDGDDVADTGFSVERTRKGRVVSTDYYHGLLVDNRLLLVQTPKVAAAGTTYTGSLVDIPANIQSDVVADLEAEYPELKGAFLPFMLRDDNFQFSGYMGLSVAAAALLLCGFMLFSAVQRMGDSSRHPIMHKLGRFGDQRLVVSELEGQLAAPHTTVGATHLTQNWFALLTSTRLDATRFEDVVWVYKQVVQRRVNGIPVGKSFAAHICDRHGNDIAVPAKEDVVNQMLAAVMQQAPWAIGGHSPEVEQAWKKSRPALVGAVDERRRQVLAGAN